jgi:hypothetical protein
MHEQYNSELLAKIKQFCIDNDIPYMVCIYETKNKQTAVSKVFPKGGVHAFYNEAYKYLNKAIQVYHADLICESCRATFTYDAVAILGPQLSFCCPHCKSEKITEV